MKLTSSLKPCRCTGVYLTHDEAMMTIHHRDESTAYRVNTAAAYIWQMCDGIRDIEEITAIVKDTELISEENIVAVVPDTISELFSRGLVSFNIQPLKPFAKLAFSAAVDITNARQHFFLKLLGRWFDLQLTDDWEQADLCINFSCPDLAVTASSLQIYVAANEDVTDLDQKYDFVFTNERDNRLTEQKNILLPQTLSNGVLAGLLAEDIAKFEAILGSEEGSDTGSIHRPPDVESGSSLKPARKKKLTIGMATFDDYDGVYFSVQAIRMYHPEVTDDTEILVIDNNPSGRCAEALRNLASIIPGYRYIAVDRITGTAVRDFVFREADTEYVMCMDSHVFLEPGSIRQLIDYFETHPDTPDLLQGPLLSDDLVSISTHFEPAWREGMYGFWSTDARGSDPSGEPFEIPMQGLGVAACRKSAWQGYNPRFKGFGGEEAYIHQKFRNAGARTLCLPFLRWMHRFSRPMGAHYPNNWEDRIRNYHIGFEEVGLDTDMLLQHFRQVTSDETVEKVLHLLEQEKKNPFDYFDAIYCINLDENTERWKSMQARFKMLDIFDRVVRFSAVNTPESHHVGCALSHRRIIKEASELGHKNVLVLEDDATFHADTLMHLRNALLELKDIQWNAFYLGGMKWGEKYGEPYQKIDGCNFLEQPKLLTCTHAVAYNNGFFDTVLNELPNEVESMQAWVKEHNAIDQYLMHQNHLVVMSPVVASQKSILSSEDEAIQSDFE